MQRKRIYFMLWILTGLTLMVLNLPAQQDLVQGNLIQFNDNGAWCWYQDERTIVDTAGAKLIVGSLGNINGVGGSARDGDVDTVIFDLNTSARQFTTLKHAFLSYNAGDDHNAPALLRLTDGRYLCMYAGHNSDTYSYYRIYSGSSWGTERSFNWDSIPGGTDFNTSYSNLYYLSAENKIYNFARTNDKSPNMMVSTDGAASWSFGGQLTVPDKSIGYVNGYFKYSSNNTDRIDFVCTEYHPRDYNTSIYHGYIRGGQSFRANGTVLDSDITDQSAPHPADFTRIFAANTVVNGITMTRAWNLELQTCADGTVATLFKARANNNELDHRFFYARLNGTTWSCHYLCKAGVKMYDSEEDYVGLGAIDPSNPDIIYLSTPFDPRDDSTDLGVREIWKGVTSDQGVSWSWTPLTENSTVDNFRPVVPAWDSTNTAIIWWRGTYTTAQRFDAAIVGLLDRPGQQSGQMVYTDADAGNTTLANGSQLSFTGPTGEMGAADSQWHQRTGYGNNNNVLTSAESGYENAPEIRTRLTASEAGTYEVWVNFWANPDGDWRIKAGLSSGNKQVFRQMACQQVAAGAHSTSLNLSGGGNTYLYQAYLGRASVAAGGTIDVYVDDEAIITGSTTQGSDKVRTWYDGVSIARLKSETAVVKGDVNEDGSVTIVDALMTAQYYVGLNPSGFVAAGADMNCDGSITIVDALMIAQYYVGLITGFSC